MEREVQNPKDPFQSEILHNLLTNLFLHSERIKRKQNFKELKKGADLDFLIQFKDVLEIHFRTQKSVKFYADLLHITEKRLNLATSKVLELTPKQIINERIILEAKRLLAHSNESIKEIGFHLGFDEPTNFIKYFRKLQNITPANFRESLSL